MKRRKFIQLSTITSLASGIFPSEVFAKVTDSVPSSKPTAPKPIVISTWKHGLEANEAAWKKLITGQSALDAVEAGVRVTESDPNNQSVGLGGLPDRTGEVTLDACIMDHRHQCGAVAFLKKIENPISVARKVMEETPHVMLVGQGALEFALSNGFKKRDLLTDRAKKAWLEWQKQQSQSMPGINHENHDTIGMLAMDDQGNLSGACTTSGWAYKMPGRVGDSPIIGAGLFVDNEVGAACATGLGEAVIRVAGSSTVVELMRQGFTPNEACKKVVERIIKVHPNLDGLQVGFIALNKHGEVGAHSVRGGFNYAQRNATQNALIDATYSINSEK